MVGTLCVVLLFVFATHTLFLYDQFCSDQADYRTTLEESSRRNVTNRVREAIHFIQFKRKGENDLLRKHLKVCVDEAWEMIDSIYQNQHNQIDPETLQSSIVEALRNVSFDNNETYFFVRTLDGISLESKTNPEHVGQGAESLPLPEMRHAVNTMLSIAINHGEGFCEYEWTTPNDEDHLYKKIAYLKTYKPLGIYFGVGFYEHTLEKYIQQSILADIHATDLLNRNDYVFVVDQDGHFLAHHENTDWVGRSINEASNVQGNVIFAQMKSITNTMKDGFLEYDWTKPGSTIPLHKTSYIEKYPDWGWILGAGYYNTDIDEALDDQKAAFIHTFQRNVVAGAIILGIAILFVLWRCRRLDRKTRDEIDFMEYSCKQAVSNNQIIDRSRLTYCEFDLLASHINTMLQTLFHVQESLLEAQRIASVGNWSYDPQTGQMSMSPECWAILGLEEDSIPLTPQIFLKSVHPDDRKMVEELIQSIQTGKAFDSVQYRVQREDSIRYVDASSQIHKEEDSPRMVGTTQDVTKLALLIEDLRQTRFAVDSCSEGVLFLDPSGKIVYSNATAQQWLGYTQEELAAITDLDITREISPQQRQEYLDQIRDDQSITLNCTCYRKDKSHFPAEASLHSIRVSSGNLICSFFRDVSERQNAEKNLQESEKRYRLLIETMQSAIFLVDRNTLEILDCNPMAEYMYGYDHDEFLQMRFDNLHKDELRARSFFSQSKKDVRFCKHFRKNHSLIHVHGTQSHVDYDGRQLSVVVIHDASETVRNQQELQIINETLSNTVQLSNQLAEQAQEANLAKNEFLANMSHEIRTPLNAIVGFADLLNMETLSAHQREYIDVITSSSRQLMSLINDILDFSKIEAGEVTIEHENCNVSEFLESIESLMRSSAENKGLSFEIECDENVPSRIHVDAPRLRQCLMNLIGNAIKFTQEGFVKTVVSFDEPSNRIRLAVMDSGIGIASEHIDKIFDAFHQGHASPADQYERTGLGLRITRELVDRMGGDISVESNPGTGTTIIIEIDAEPPRDEVPHHTPEPMLDQLKPLAERDETSTILVAEDNIANQKLIERLLQKCNCTAIIAKNGQHALDLLDEYQPDIILMDWQMPVLDGLETTKILRSRGVRTPIIALTASAMKGDRQTCIDAGCDDYLTKPIIFSNLIAILNHYLGVPQQQ